MTYLYPLVGQVVCARQPPRRGLPARKGSPPGSLHRNALLDPKV